MASLLLPLVLQQYMVQAHTQQMRQRTRTPPPTPPPIAAAYVTTAESMSVRSAVGEIQTVTADAPTHIFEHTYTYLECNRILLRVE